MVHVHIITTGILTHYDIIMTILLMHQVVKNLILFWISFFHIDIHDAQESSIDKDHLKDYPYCGDMRDPSIAATGRVVNSKDCDKDFRWVALLIRTVAAGTDDVSKELCSGTVITDR